MSIKFILSLVTLNSLNVFFQKNNLNLNNYQLNELYRYIKLNQNNIDENNFQNYLFSENLKIDNYTKNKIKEILIRFI